MRGTSQLPRIDMDVLAEIRMILDDVLVLKGRAADFGLDTPLLGALPELDSMAVLSIITTLEEHFGFVIADDELDGQVFSTVGHLVDFVAGKLQT